MVGVRRECDGRSRPASMTEYATDHIALERIVRAAADGDAVAWERLVSRYGPRVLRVARAQGLNHHDAEDAAQATWVQLSRHISCLRDPACLATWLTTTTRREAVRISRRGRREKPMGEGLPDVPAAPDDDRELTASVRRRAVSRALGDLPEQYRQLVRALTSEPPPSYAQVAARLGIPIGSIGPLRGRCLERLRRHHALRELLEIEG
jgi:RNA polymerase sigma factor (sigma-70 family)